MACTTDFSTIIDATGNITCKRADTFNLQTAFTNVDDDSPHDLSVYDTIVAHVKSDAKDPTYIMAFSIGNGFSVNQNILIWSKTPQEMLVESKGYVYDIEATKGSIVTTIGGGTFTVTPDVTRSTDVPV